MNAPPPGNPPSGNTFPDPSREEAPRPVAVIDIGTNLIRMAVAEIDAAGRTRTLENLSQPVNLGKDTFTRGSIQKSTVEACVRILLGYRQVLKEFGITDPGQMRVVATSAVREAQNRLAFLDRIYIATGIEVDPIEEAEVSRITYLGVQKHLKAAADRAEAAGAEAEQTVVVEIGGGSTELLLAEGEDVNYTHTYRLGALRLREVLQSYRAPLGRMRAIMENQIQRTVEQIAQHVDPGRPKTLIALGGDIRFAAAQVEAAPAPDRLAELPVSRLLAFTDEILELSEDELVRKHHLSFSGAETLGPALLAYTQLARRLGVETIHVSSVNLRDGLLQDMARREEVSEAFNRQIIRSALDLGRRFDCEQAHALKVAELARTLFAEMRGEHQLGDRYAVILEVAALLHEAGLYIGQGGFHKHSMYLILHSELFGLSPTDLRLAALVARYHRRAAPKPTHAGYTALDREQRVAVSKLAAILRVADALDRSHSQRVREIRCAREDEKFLITVPHVDDLSLEQLAIKQKGTLFEDIFGRRAVLRRLRP